jgi:hypothetical protein
MAKTDDRAVAAKATELKKELQRLVKAIVDEDDYSVETADRAIRTLSSLKDLKLKESLSFRLDDGLAVPQEFRCPISRELMRDPVVLATGQVACFSLPLSIFKLHSRLLLWEFWWVWLNFNVSAIFFFFFLAYIFRPFF